jgi:hypothetical protein
MQPCLHSSRLQQAQPCSPSQRQISGSYIYWSSAGQA